MGKLILTPIREGISITNSLISRAVVCAGIVGLFVSLAAQPVMAKKSSKSPPEIVEVHITFGSDVDVDDCLVGVDDTIDTITIIGEDLTRKNETVVFLAEQGPLTLLPTDLEVQLPRALQVEY